MWVISVAVGAFEANCYLVGADASPDLVVVDAGAEPSRIWEAIQATGRRAGLLLNTHAHLDHIGAVQELKKLTGVPFWLHAGDGPMLADPELNLSAWSGQPVVAPPADAYLQDGQEFLFAGLNWRVLHTPGHTPGSVCFLVRDAPKVQETPGVAGSPGAESAAPPAAGAPALFSGDTLFAGSVGRTDFPGGDPRALARSLQALVREVPEDARIYPGHGPATSMEEERRCNFYLQGRRCGA